MAVKKERFVNDIAAAFRRPIELITENGFSIVRRCDVDESTSPAGTKHLFLVRDPHGYEIEISVNIAGSAVAEIIKRSNGRLDLDCSYWICCAERHLTAYLWEFDDYPPDDSLEVRELTLEDLDQARRWDREK